MKTKVYRNGEGGGEDLAKGKLKYMSAESPGGLFSVSVKITGNQAGLQKPV